MSQYPNERGVRRQGYNGPGSGTFGESPASGPAPTTAGFHKHDVLNKLDPRVDSTQDKRPAGAVTGQSSNIPEGTYGPHKSRVANALDPRVDSDMDHRGPTAPGAGAGGMMHGAGSGGGMGTTARHQPPTGTVPSSGNNVPEGTYGPHRSRVANALDPRVDSDRDNTYRGASGASGSVGGVGTAGSTHASYGTAQQQSGYPHSGLGAASAGNAPIGMSGPGPAPNTAGPHRSDIMNKLDPRVDSKAGKYQGETTMGYEGRRGI